MTKHAYISQGRLPGHPCPACQRTLSGITAATSSDTRPSPKAGDLTMCSYCRTILAFTADLGFRIATDAEIDALHPLTARAYREIPLLPSNRLPKNQ